MLAALTIRDVVLIDRLELEFGSGLAALTGETGAGKSILLDALGLALGSRADARLVRHGSSHASVSARFEVAADHPAYTMLQEQGIGASDDGIVLRRTLGADGRSRAYINDQPVGVALLRQVGETLVEIHGQFESQRLLDPASHRELLDAYGGTQPSATATAFRDWRDASRARRAAAEALEAAKRDEDYLRHVVAELEKLDPQVGEEAELAERRAFLMNAEKLAVALEDAARELSGGERSVDAALRGALRHLERIAERVEGRLEPVIASLERAASEAEEAEAQLNRVAADLDLDPRHLEEAEERLFALRALARKHACAVDDLARLRDDLTARLLALEDGSDRLARLREDEQAARRRYQDAAAALSAARRDAAVRLDAAVADELEPLRLGKATFVTGIDTLDDKDWGEAGWDRVAFEIATNPGMPPGPISRIASGGELARFMLALKVVLARADPISTLIFDEVDAGIGGAVAAAVGERLARLAHDVQVLVVTHSPQVAARGDSHWRISKMADADRTTTIVEGLDADGRKEEIARMLAGARITDEARAAADRLLHVTPQSPLQGTGT
ncbi:MAG: DNA repair protein RecN [Rhodospirillales bacterium]|nr:DNA repair protein RecN [Rhodospirillales bacterium]